MNEQELGSLKFLKLKYRKGDQIIQPFSRIGSLQEFRSPVLSLSKYWKIEKTTAGSCKIHWNVLNDA